MSEYGTYKTVKAKLWPGLAGKSPYNHLSSLRSETDLDVLGVVDALVLLFHPVLDVKLQHPPIHMVHVPPPVLPRLRLLHNSHPNYLRRLERLV